MHFHSEEQRDSGWRGCIGRHGGERHRGFFGRHGRHGRGGGGDGFRIARKLGAGDLQLLLLALLAENPRHGYELIKELESRTSGFYSPSPGMIYPALTYLEEIGFATVEAEANKKLYRITETGTGFLAENKAMADAILAELAEIGRRMAKAQKAMAEEEGEDAEDDEESEKDTWPLGERRFGRHRRGAAILEILQARRELRRAMMEKIGASPEDHKRIAEVLRKAAEEIRGK
jgi:DNA-binding PadR family transcriptional regulator